ncbi:MAG: ATPase, T2SS/T4P/T4SS family, partial [Gammaproteobacteria bacterium]|nr:ATPase, T2SS/T4P/T4SS family [Gammaproteobacteria bacterium]
MATPGTQIHLGGLARKLIQDGLLDDAQAQNAQEAALKGKIPLVTQLVNQKLVDSLALAQAASEEFGVPLFDIDAINIEPDTIKLVKEDLIRKHRTLPLFKRGNRLYVAVSDPTNLDALDEIKFHVGVPTEAVLVLDDKLGRCIDKAIEATDSGLSALADSDLDDVEFSDEDDDKGAGVTESDADDTPVVRFVNKVLLDAINKGASDIHFEPYEKTYRVRFRQDGILKEVAAPPVNMAPRLSARLKVMSRLDISERRIPQDGRIKLNLSKNRAIDFRVNTCPTL